MPSQIRELPAGLAGEVRRVVAGARLQIDHQHAELEFDLVTNGGGSVTLGGRNYLLRPGTLIWLVPGEPHRLVRSPGLEMWVVALKPGLIAPEHVKAMAARPLRLLPGNELIDLDRLLSQVAQDSDEPEVYNAGITYIARRAWRISRDSPRQRARPMHPAVARALMLLREKGAAIALSELAAAAGTTAPYLSRLLIEHTGRSFVDWRNRIRLDRFIKDYKPGANLLDAALDAGFGSYARFNHIFNEMVGCSPREWVKRTDRTALDEPPAEEAPSSSPAYGVPAATVHGAQQRWAALVPLAAPAIVAILGKGFLARLLAAVPETSPPAPFAFEPLDPSLPAAAREQLIASLRGIDAALADDLERLMESHAFADLYLRILDAYGLSTTRLADGVTALLGVIWMMARILGDPGQPQAVAAAAQVRGALHNQFAGLDAQTARPAYTAIICHFACCYYALQAARASGDRRALEQLRDAALRFGRQAFGGDVSELDLGPRGFVRQGAGRAMRKPGGKRASRKQDAAAR